jgi:TetR/AcrR family transcriptional regulator, tetracycline repressor protein
MARPRSGEEKLTVEGILSAALRIVDRDGVSGLSMRRLGKDLGVDPMAIYHHLPNKQAIIAGLVQQVFEEFLNGLGEPTRKYWRDRVRHWALTYHAVARRHANLIVHLVSNADAASESLMKANEVLYAALDSSGMAPQDVMRSADMIVDYTHGVILGQTSRPAGATDWRTVFQQRPKDATGDELVTIQRVFKTLDETDFAVDVEFGLDVIIAGLERKVVP